MPDFIDNVVDKATDINDVVLKGLLSNPQDSESSLYCQNDMCGEEIPEGRRKLPGVKYCIDCQSFVERHPSLKFSSQGRVIKQEVFE